MIANLLLKVHKYPISFPLSTHSSPLFTPSRTKNLSLPQLLFLQLISIYLYMASHSHMNVPRWTPNPSPTRSPIAKQDLEMSSFDSQEDLSYGEEGLFPFSTKSIPHHSSTPAHPSAVTYAAANSGSSPTSMSFEAPSLRTVPEIMGSRDVEAVMVSSSQEEPRRAGTWGSVVGGVNEDGVFLTWGGFEGDGVKWKRR